MRVFVCQLIRLYSMHACFHRGQKKVSDFLDLEFPVVYEPIVWVQGTEPGAHQNSTHPYVLSPLFSPKNTSFAVYWA